MTTNALNALTKDPLALAGRLKDLQPGRASFRVVDGHHAGAELALNGGTVTIGADLGNTIVLLDPGIAARHVSIELKSGLVPALRVRALEGPVHVNGNKYIEIGQYADLQLPARLVLAGITTEFVPSVDYLQTAKRLAPYALYGVGGLLLFLMLSSAISSIGASFSSMPPSAISSDVADPGSALHWREQLGRRLAEAGLGTFISVESGSLGNLVATGEIDGQAADRWREIIKWYDAQAAAPLLVNNVTRGQGVTSAPSVRAVWFDARPQVSLDDGRSVGIGDTTPSGWKLEAIEDGSVTFIRDGKSVKVAF